MSNFKFERFGSDLVFTIKGQHIKRTLTFSSEAEAIICKADVLELLWALERSWKDAPTRKRRAHVS